MEPTARASVLRESWSGDLDGMVERVGEFYKATPRKRLGDPAQLDSTLLYLCAPSSECVTGTIIKVDDGQGSR